jgi:hypothetical protein
MCLTGLEASAFDLYQARFSKCKSVIVHYELHFVFCLANVQFIITTDGMTFSMAPLIARGAPVAGFR